MLMLIAENWRLYVLRGILAMAFGCMALIWPGLTLGVLVMLFGIYVILEGILALTAAFKHRGQRSWWLLLLEGIAGIGAGMFAFIWPGLTAVVLLLFIAVWAMLTGILEIAAAVELRKEMEGEWVLGLAGAVSILIGILLIANPGTGALAVIWLIGVYALLFGGLLTYLGFKVRKHRLVGL